MTKNEGILLRFHSGPHAGAEVVLPAGVHVLGSEDSCDIILVDASLEGRHAAVTVALAGNDYAVQVAPLDGAVHLGAEAVPQQGMAVPPCHVCRIGSTTMAWNRHGEVWTEPAAGNAPGADAPAASGEAGNAASAAGARAGAAPGGTPGAGTASSPATQGGPSADGTLPTATTVAVDDVGMLELSPVNGGRLAQLRRLPRRSVVAALLALLCLCGIAIGFEGQRPDAASRAALLELALHEAGLGGVSVSAVPRGVVVRGILQNEEQRAKLWDMAQNMLYPVQIEATVRDDVLNAVRAAFSSRALYPEVSFMGSGSHAVSMTKPPQGGIAHVQQAGTASTANTMLSPQPVASGNAVPGQAKDAPSDAAPETAQLSTTAAPEGKGVVSSAPAAATVSATGGTLPLGAKGGTAVPALRVAGYFKDGLVEAWAFSALREDVPGVPELVRDIRHESHVAALLDGLLKAAELGHVQVRYLPGVVELAGNLDVKQRTALDEVLTAVRAGLGVPVRFDVRPGVPATPDKAGKRQEASGTVAAAAPAVDTAARAPARSAMSFFSSDPLGGLEVVGVTLSPLRFISTADGQRFFEGGMLPGGHVLEVIGTSELQLRKDGRSISYRLRGSHE